MGKVKGKQVRRGLIFFLFKPDRLKRTGSDSDACVTGSRTLSFLDVSTHGSRTPVTSKSLYTQQRNYGHTLAKKILLEHSHKQRR